MSGPQHTTDPILDNARDRLASAIAAASTTGEPESPAVCDAVGEVVAGARAEGQPPERVLVAVKEVAHRVLDQLRPPIDRARATVAWIVRCAVKAYYGRA